MAIVSRDEFLNMTNTAPPSSLGIEEASPANVAPETQDLSGGNIVSREEFFTPSAEETDASELGIIEPLTTLATGAAIEPVAGVAGALTSAAQTTGPRSAFGAAFSDPEEIEFAGPDVATEVIEGVREAGTFQPRSESGKEGLRAFGEALGPVAEKLQGFETFLGDEAFEATGSPAIAAAYTTIPTVMLELLGVGLTKGALRPLTKTKQFFKNKEVKNLIKQATPEPEQIKNASRLVFNELSESGVKVKPLPIRRLVESIEREVIEQGLDPQVTPRAFGAMKRLKNEVGVEKSLTEIDTLRKVAQGAASSADLTEANLGRIMVESIDDFYNTAPNSTFSAGSLTPKEVAVKNDIARSLWGKARKAELIQKSFESADLTRGGLESGLTNEFRKILKNDRVNKFFKPEEIAAMKLVVKDGSIKSIARFVGRFGGPIGFAGGGAFFGPLGAIAVPIIGQTSRRGASAITVRGAEVVDRLIRAGSNAEAITKAYINNTPKAMRTTEKLTELLIKGKVDMSEALTSKNTFLRKAAEIAKGMRILEASATASAGGLGATKQLDKGGKIE